ncbi:MAG: hypothetical protein RIS94_1992 [Pseudomonadota bacterium]
MAELCSNCGAKIHRGAFFFRSNEPISEAALATLNLVNGTHHEAMCGECGGEPCFEALLKLQTERDQIRANFPLVAAHFPVTTIDALPTGDNFSVLGLVSATVVADADLQDQLRADPHDALRHAQDPSARSCEANQIEGSARTIMVRKALRLGANCIVGVSVAYGATGARRFAVTMQGTAAKVPSVEAVFGSDAREVVEWAAKATERLENLDRWICGDIRPGDVYLSQRQVAAVQAGLVAA